MCQRPGGSAEISVGSQKKTRYVKKNLAETPSDSVKSVCAYFTS